MSRARAKYKNDVRNFHTPKRGMVDPLINSGELSCNNRYVLYVTKKNTITLHYCAINIQHVSPRRIISLAIHKEHLDTSINNSSKLFNLHLLV